MTPIDYGRSFITTSGDISIDRINGNAPRFQIESRCRLINDDSGKTSDYYQCCSCKSEVTYRPKDFFTMPNYDFTPIFGDTVLIAFRRYAKRNDDEYIKYHNIKDVFGTHKTLARELKDAVELKTGDDVVKATRDCLPIIAQTELRNPQNQMRAIIEYPVKTMNVHAESNEAFQPDTGVVLFPNIANSINWEFPSFKLAYIIFNSKTYSEFIVEEPVLLKKIKKNVVQAYHYEGIYKTEAINRLFADPCN